MNSRLQKTSHKYGVELPRSVKEAIKINRKNGNSFWADALTKEMGNVSVAFKILGSNVCAPPGWHKASGHIVFDVKMDFTHKARWVKDGHKMPNSPTASFAGVVSWESIRISLMYAALLGLPVWGADIRNAYLQAPSSEKHLLFAARNSALKMLVALHLSVVLCMVAKLQEEIFGTTFGIVWAIWVSLLPKQTPMYGSGFQSNPQGRNIMSMFCSMSTMSL